MPVIHSALRRSLLPGLLGVLVALFPLLFVYQASLNHDVALLLTAAESILEGRWPVAEVTDVNPPLMSYLGLAPVLLARVTGVPIEHAAALCVLGLILLSLVFLRRLLSLPPLELDAGERAVVHGFWLLASLATYALGQFGQREHIFVLTYVPFLVLRLARHVGAPVHAGLAVVLGLLAFAGSALKPSLLATLLAVELVTLARSRCWRALLTPECLAYATAGLAYAGHFLVLSQLREYFTRWVPLLLSGYSAYSSPWTEVLAHLARQPIIQLGLFVVVVVAYISRRRPGPTNGLVAGLITLLLCTAFFFVHQAKGWSYHLLPVWFATFLLGAVLLIQLERLLGRNDAAGGRALPSLVMGGLVLVALCMFPELPRDVSRIKPPSRSYGAYYDALLAHSRPGDAVLFITPAVTPAFPAQTLARRRPGSRYLCTFPLALFYRDASDYRSWDEASAAERRFYRELVEDVSRRQPRVVFVNTKQGPQGCAPFFSVDEYLARRGFYAEALRDYVENEPLGRFRMFVRSSTRLVRAAPPPS